MATIDLKELVNKSILALYDELNKQYIGTQISNAVTKLGTIVTVKGKVATTEELPTDGVAAGDLYFVGPDEGGEYEEYIYADGAWEYIGTTEVSLDGYVTETALYKGADGTGTLTTPATGTILEPIVARIKAVEDVLATASIMSEDDVRAMFAEATA